MKPTDPDKEIERKQLLIDGMETSFKDDITLAKLGMIQNSKIKFLMTSICKKDPILKADLPCPTAAANGKNIFIDPEFWKKLNNAQRMRCLFHEGFHNMFGHCVKQPKIHTKDQHMVHNIAADCVVESYATLCGVGEGKYAEGTINPSQYGNVTLNINGKKLIIDSCHNRTVEEIYDLIMLHIKNNPAPDGFGPLVQDENGKDYTPIDGHDMTEETPEDKSEREQALRQALVEHKLKGTMPGALADMIEKMLKGKVNWRAELRDMVLPEIKSYQSCKKRNRRTM